jgi:hypothetical protein
MLAEVKMRLTLPPIIEMRTRPQPSEISILKEFWNDAILVMIVPDNNVFYAQRIDEIKEPDGFCLSLDDFERLESIFTKVNGEHILHYREIALPILQLFMSKTQKDKFETQS